MILMMYKYTEEKDNRIIKYYHHGHQGLDNIARSDLKVVPVIDFYFFLVFLFFWFLWVAIVEVLEGCGCGQFAVNGYTISI
mgnify:CR=1 FL=1